MPGIAVADGSQAQALRAGKSKVKKNKSELKRYKIKTLFF
jgi:hypothetical protein